MSGVRWAHRRGLDYRCRGPWRMSARGHTNMARSTPSDSPIDCIEEALSYVAALSQACASSQASRCACGKLRHVCSSQAPARRTHNACRVYFHCYEILLTPSRGGLSPDGQAMVPARFVERFRQPTHYAAPARPFGTTRINSSLRKARKYHIARYVSSGLTLQDLPRAY